MKSLLIAAFLGLYVVALSALPPEHARWPALALLVLVAATPAVGRR